MRSLACILVLALICQLSVADNTVTAKTPLDPCVACTVIVGSFQQVINKQANPETVLQQLDRICGAVSQFVPQEQCTSFVRAYAQYILDKVNSASSTVQPDYLCRDVLGFCSASNDGPVIETLFPSFGENGQITFTAVETGFTSNEPFYYKAFLGDQSYALDVSVTEIHGASIALRVQESSEQLSSAPVDSFCSEGADCFLRVQQPEAFSWYYIQVTPSVEGTDAASFVLTLNQNGPSIGEEGSGWGPEPSFETHVETHTHLVPIFPLLLLVGAMICCCCCARRRRACKRKQQQRQMMELADNLNKQQQHTVVDLQAFPEQPQQPIGYLYYPIQQGVGYPPYGPQAYIPMQVSAPPATQENLA